MYYSILHKTRFRYSDTISESITEARMQPRSEGFQRCLEFKLKATPQARVHKYRDSYGNMVHHFDIPGHHRQLTISAEATVVFTAPPVLPERLGPNAWEQLDALTAVEDHWDFLTDSFFARSTPLLRQLAEEFQLKRQGDPLSFMRELTERMFETFAYAPQTTRVDSPIDEALAARRGVCQDFTHIMTALVRSVGIPCRYVSGYLYHRSEDKDRSERDATHAWVEVLLPELGWVGFDPTNNLIARDRHIRAAIGRDYADVPPTRGVFRGGAESKLEVGVKVLPTEVTIPEDEVLPIITGTIPAPEQDNSLEQEQQQQQQ